MCLQITKKTFIYTFLHAESALFHLISAYRSWFRHRFIGFESGQPLWTSECLVTKRTAVWLGSYNRQRAFNFGRVFSIVRIECLLSITYVVSNCRTVVHYVKLVCNCRKSLPRFQTNVTVTKSITICRNRMKRYRFGVQNGVISKRHSSSAGSSALSKLDARCQLYDPTRTVVHYVTQVCNFEKDNPVSKLRWGWLNQMRSAEIKWKCVDSACKMVYLLHLFRTI